MEEIELEDDSVSRSQPSDEVSAGAEIFMGRSAVPAAAFTPWSVSCVRRTMDGQGWYRIVGDGGYREIAYVPFGDRMAAEYAECTTHARLIAAAPELYASLSEFMDNPLFEVAVGGNPNMVEAMLNRARAALSKALGQGDGAHDASTPGNSGTNQNQFPQGRSG